MDWVCLVNIDEHPLIWLVLEWSPSLTMALANLNAGQDSAGS